MLEQKYFNFTHTLDDEKTKLSLFTHYRISRVSSSIHNDDQYCLNQLRLLADSPVNTSEEFGTKMVIALTFARPSEFFRRCVSNGQLEQYFPELFNCVGCKQNSRYHQDDVFDHTMLALDKVECPEVVGDSTGFLSSKDLLDIKLAILFHDIGKPLTKKVIQVETD